MKQLTKYFVLSLVAGAACFFLFSGSSSAATIDVVAGTDENTDNGSCSLTEAITNINGQATNEPDCVPTGAYGTDDTINLPTGTIALSADLPQITESLTIAGQGMGESIIDGDGQWEVLFSSADFSLSGLTITAHSGIAVLGQGLVSTIINQVEIDGTGSVTAGALGGFMLARSGINMTNVYIHDLAGDGTSSVFGVSIQAVQGLSVSATLENITIENLSSNDSQVNAISFATGVLDGSFTAGTIEAAVSNSTITGITSGSSSATAIGGIAAVNGADTEITLTATNNTISAISGEGGIFAGSANIGVAGVALGGEDTATTTIISSNNVFAGDAVGCADVGDLAPVFSLGNSAGTLNLNISSTGGNLSDDSSCEPYFTEPTDQNNVTGLAASLSPLADNGGYVPTMALLETSPAVDSGVTVSGLTTDARLATRPQGNAYDSGAYESPYTKPTDPLEDDGEGLAESGQYTVVVAALAIISIVAGPTLALQKQSYKR